MSRGRNRNGARRRVRQGSIVDGKPDRVHDKATRPWRVYGPVSLAVTYSIKDQCEGPETADAEIAEPEEDIDM